MPEQLPNRFILLPHVITGEELRNIATGINQDERVKLVLERELDVIEFDAYPLTVDYHNQKVVSRSREARLTRREFSILGHLALQPDVVMSRDELVTTLWKTTPKKIDTHVVNVHISNTHKKMERLQLPSTPIRNVYGRGYVFDSTPHRPTSR
jgi:DNA-binding response OmpR family regulator